MIENTSNRLRCSKYRAPDSETSKDNIGCAAKDCPLAGTLTWEEMQDCPGPQKRRKPAKKPNN